MKHQLIYTLSILTLFSISVFANATDKTQENELEKPKEPAFFDRYKSEKK